MNIGIIAHNSKKALIEDFCIAYKNILSKLEYDDYDRLIQLCDLLVTGMGFGTIKERMAYVKDKYNLPTILIKKRYRQALMLKNYFDRRCGCDVYRLLGVN